MITAAVAASLQALEQQAVTSSRAAGRRRRCAVKREPRGSRGSPRQRHAANLRPQGPEKRSKTPNRRRFTAVGGAVLSRSVGGAKHPSDGAAELITH